MARILVVEDEEVQLRLIRLHLETAGHTVTVAGNVPAALEAIMQGALDLVVADIAMPGLDGFALLAAVRANKSTAQLPLLFLTALHSAEVVPKARALGVSEVLQKPLHRDSFLAAVRRCLAQEPGTVGSAGRLEHTTALRASALFAGEGSREKREQTAATVLFVDIRNFVTTAERLSSAETAALLETYLGSVSEEVESHRGMVVKTMGDGLLALFQELPDEPEHHAGRALKAALKIVFAARQFRPWIARHFPGQELPEFVVGIGVHTGDVVLCQMTTESGTEHTVIGDTVNVAARLEGQSKVLGWSIVASVPTIAAAGARFVVGARASVRLKGRDAAVEVGELIGLSPREGSTVPNWRVYKQFVAAVTENTDALRRSQETPLREQ